MALALAMAGALGLYLASVPGRVSWIRPRLARMASVVLLVASLARFVTEMKTVAGIFSFVTVVMLALVVITYVGAYLRRKPGRR